MASAIVGVGGGSASGKTTLVARVVEHVGSARATVVEHDRYYRDHSKLSPTERAALNYDHPDALESALLVEHLRRLRKGVPVQVPRYDFSSHGRLEGAQLIHPLPLIIVEGILVLADERLRALMDVKVFVEAREATRLSRRLARDTIERGRSPESVLAQWVATVQPMHQAFVEPTRQFADFVVDGDAGGDEGCDRLLSRLRELTPRSQA